MLGSEIIADADVRVPNAFDVNRKIAWLNEVHSEFFEIVKIPASTIFTTSIGQDTYTLIPTDIRARNIVEVVVGTERYRSVLFDQDIRPGHNYYEFNDSTRQLKLLPPPASATVGRVRYYRVPAASFTSFNYTTTEPDSPKEFHWIYVLGLCARIAKAMKDVRLAQNFDTDYKGALLIAQQNLNLSRPENPGVPVRQQSD